MALEFIYWVMERKGKGQREREVQEKEGGCSYLFRRGTGREREYRLEEVEDSLALAEGVYVARACLLKRWGTQIIRS